MSKRVLVKRPTVEIEMCVPEKRTNVSYLDALLHVVSLGVIDCNQQPLCNELRIPGRTTYTPIVFDSDEVLELDGAKKDEFIVCGYILTGAFVTQAEDLGRGITRYTMHYDQFRYIDNESSK